ncbi:Hypothetical protein Cp262_1542 [Corynebacterium pseudotuberculosis]|nr:Hypothetical protein Cp262_1542 [Corynebacterium pseudotuberculosis]
MHTYACAKLTGDKTIENELLSIESVRRPRGCAGKTAQAREE